MRVTFYFDGFNFYNGLKDKSNIDRTWKNYYWLDLVKFCNEFLSEEHSLVKVKYFTAPPSDDLQRSKQSAFFAANKLLNRDLVEIIKGKYQNKDILCKICKKVFIGQEEKRTDVNISLNMAMDCVLNNTDILILVSADSDQIPTIQTIKTNFPDKKVKVYFPPQRNSADILSICKPIVFLDDNEDKFKNAVMNTIVTNGIKNCTRPENWKK